MFKHLCLVILLALTPILSSLTAQADEVAVATQSQVVNINAADAETLAAGLKGVGQSRAEAIVRYRDTYGPFFSIEDLMEVRGVGESVLENNRGRITLE